MKRFAALALLATGTVAAQVTDHPPSTVHVPVELKATAQEQMRFASMLAQKIGQAQTNSERQVALMTAVSHLEIIPQRWPHETALVFQAGLLEGDVFGQYGAPRNALDVLTRLAAIAHGAPQRLEVERRRGTTLAKLERMDEADAVFRAALEIPTASPQHRLPLLNDVAAFYYRFQDRQRDRSRILRQIAGLQQNELAAMVSLIGSLESNLRIPDLAEARADYRELVARYEVAQRHAPPAFGSGDAGALDVVRNTIDRFRSQSQ